MLGNATFNRTVVGLFLLEIVGSLAIPGPSWASLIIGQPVLTNCKSASATGILTSSLDNLLYTSFRPQTLSFSTSSVASLQYYTGISTVTCLWQPTQADKQQQCQFTLALAINGQEIENQFITNTPIYTRTLQYLGGDIAQDVYLHLSGKPDSVIANSATYLRQYGTTSHSTVLLTFPVAEKLLRKGCRLTFRSRQLDLRTRQFVFTARDFQHIHHRATPAH